MKKLLILALALVAALGVVSSASAKSRDRNHDRLPDRWERTHHLSLKVKQAKRDQDKDGLNNRGEFRAKTNPRDEDTDNDGIDDGNEQAGTIKSFEGGVLTISLAQGGVLSAKVDDETEIECHGTGDLTTRRARTSSEGDDDGPSHDEGDDHGDDGPSHDEGDDHGDDAPSHEAGDHNHGDHADHADHADHGDFEHGDNEGEDGDDVNEHGDDDDDSCGQEALTAGTKVHEAELEATSDGSRWEELELLSAS